MSFQKIKAVSEQVLNRIPSVRGKGEQATKQSLVLPILDALGYDIWNPAEVCPEYEADFAIKKAGQKEKVDLAILLDGTPRIYFEVKPLDFELEGHEGQLSRYFNSTSTVTLGVLTNGIEWKFYTDTGNPNVMDALPFHIVKLDAADQGLDVLARFAKQVFSAEAIRDYATELRYTAQIAEFLRKELDLKDKEPSEYFLRWILKADHMYEGIVNANVLDRFRPIAKDALTRVVREIVRRSITAMEKEAAQPVKVAILQHNNIGPAVIEQDDGEDDKRLSGCDEEASGRNQRSIVTTEKELAVFGIVKEVFTKSTFSSASITDPRTRKDIPIVLTYKDTTGYFGIFFNKPSWWILRLSIEGRKNWIGFNVDEERGLALIPKGVIRMDPSPFASFRVQISVPEDVACLEGLLIEAFKKTITDRLRTGQEEES